MAKNSFPMMKTGGGLLSKLVGTLVTLAVLAFVVKHPSEAGSLANGALAALGSAVDGLATFLSQLKQ